MSFALAIDPLQAGAKPSSLPPQTRPGAQRRSAVQPRLEPLQPRGRGATAAANPEALMRAATRRALVAGYSRGRPLGAPGVAASERAHGPGGPTPARHDRTMSALGSVRVGAARMPATAPVASR
jgi:hypothetical protein